LAVDLEANGALRLSKLGVDVELSSSAAAVAMYGEARSLVAAGDLDCLKGHAVDHDQVVSVSIAAFSVCSGRSRRALTPGDLTLGLRHAG
jgi:hypothetical protein